MKKILIATAAIAFILSVTSCAPKREGCPGIAKTAEKVRTV